MGDRQSFHESHLAFYYEKYFGKPFPDLKLMNLESFGGLCDLIKETTTLNGNTKFVEVALPEDAPIDKLLRQTEQHRRERQQCVDAGDESASLKFTKPAPKYQGGRGGGGYQGRSSGGGGRDQQWDRNNSRGGNSDRGGSSWGSSSYGDKNASYNRASSGGQEKRSYGGRDESSYSQSKYSRNDSGGGSRGYESRSGGGGSGGGYGNDRRGYR